MAVFYVDSRAIQRRLDEVIGPFDWKNQYTQWQGASQLCGIAIYNAERNEWVGKFDGAENTDIEAVKGGLSDAFKRAACVWGVGRYLYEVDGVWVEVEKRGNSTVIKQSEYSKLEKAYNAAVSRIFGTAIATTAEPPVKKEPTASAPQTSRNVAPPAQVSAPSKVTPAPQPQPNNNQTQTPSSGDYTVKSVKSSGKSSSLLELVDSAGEVISAYVKSGDKAIVAGSRMSKVTMEQKSGNYGAYNVLSDYCLAA